MSVFKKRIVVPRHSIERKKYAYPGIIGLMKSKVVNAKMKSPKQNKRTGRYEGPSSCISLVKEDDETSSLLLPRSLVAPRHMRTIKKVKTSKIYLGR